MALLWGSVQQGLIYALLALGIYISFRILNIPDLTADGSYTLGLAVSGLLTVSGHPLLALLVAPLAGAAAGCVTGLLQTKAGIHPVLSGILTMFALQSVNLFVLGAPNVSLLGRGTLFSLLLGLVPGANANLVRTVIALVMALAFMGLARWFFTTQLGLSIRATGSNEEMVRASSINVDAVKIVGFALANGLVALSGALMAQYQGYADVNAGVGTVTIGLASVIIGEVICGRRGLTIGLLSALLGALVYRLILAGALKLKLPTYSFQIISAVIIAAALAAPAIKRRIQFARAKKGGARRA